MKKTFILACLFAFNVLAQNPGHYQIFQVDSGELVVKINSEKRVSIANSIADRFDAVLVELYAEIDSTEHTPGLKGKTKVYKVSSLKLEGILMVYVDASGETVMRHLNRETGVTEYKELTDLEFTSTKAKLKSKELSALIDINALRSVGPAHISEGFELYRINSNEFLFIKPGNYYGKTAEGVDFKVVYSDGVQFRELPLSKVKVEVIGSGTARVDAEFKLGDKVIDLHLEPYWSERASEISIRGQVQNKLIVRVAETADEHDFLEKVLRAEAEMRTKSALKQRSARFKRAPVTAGKLRKSKAVKARRH